MNYVKIIVKSNYVDLRLFTKENDTLKALELIRTIHTFTNPNTLDYSPYRGHYKRPPNDLLVTLRRVKIDNKKSRATGANKKLTAICENSFNILQSKLTAYSKAAA